MLWRISFGFPLLLVVACSSTSASNPAADAGPALGGTGDEAGTVGCSGQGDTYSANLAKPGVNGVYTFTLVQAVPAPPDLAGNVWTIKIADKSGVAPALAQVVVYPFMPLMGHGSDQTPTVVANADGSFTASDVYLFMPGLWAITVKVTQTGDAGATGTPLIVDQAVYNFCID